MPCWLGYIPVQKDARAGLQTGLGVYAFGKKMPFATNESNAGVRSSGVPKQFAAQGPWSSVRKTTIFGRMTLSYALSNFGSGDIPMVARSRIPYARGSSPKS